MQWIKQAQAYLIGAAAERYASRFLRRQGLELIGRNFRCRGGEIDLIFREGEQWVFVEVKFRRQRQYGQASEYFHASKRRKFERAMLTFMQLHGLNPAHADHRIDLLAIEGKHIQWFKQI